MSSPAILSLISEADSCQFTWQPSGTRHGPTILLARQPWSPEADRAQRAELDRVGAPTRSTHPAPRSLRPGYHLDHC